MMTRMTIGMTTMTADPLIRWAHQILQAAELLLEEDDGVPFRTPCPHPRSCGLPT